MTYVEYLCLCRQSKYIEIRAYHPTISCHIRPSSGSYDLVNNVTLRFRGLVLVDNSVLLESSNMNGEWCIQDLYSNLIHD